MALKSGPDKVKHFIHLYSLLEQIYLCGKQGDKKSAELYRAIVNGIPSGRTTENKNWRANVFDNTYLESVYKHRRGDYTKRGLGCSILLLFVRNCTQHLMDKSVVGAKVKFRYGHISWMLHAAFPGFFHEFQSAMVWTGVEDKKEH